jgi:outer membrane biosynthesis protein TonB
MPSSKHLKAPKIICNHLTIVSGPSSHKKDEKVKKFVISGPSSSKVKEEKVEKQKIKEERKSKEERVEKHKVEEHQRDKKAEKAKSPKKPEKPKKGRKASRPSCWSAMARGGTSSTYPLHTRVIFYANATRKPNFSKVSSTTAHG